MSEKTDNSKNSSNQIEIQNFLLAGGTLSSTSSLLSSTWLPHLRQLSSGFYKRDVFFI
jgi:hypothetical protein